MNNTYIDTNTIIANPNFDVIEFVKYLNIHIQNNKIIRTLCKDPTIVLAIIESGYGDLLERRPKYINKEIFKSMHELGFEVWTKTSNKTKGSVWYGVVVNDEMCLNFRYLANRYENNSQEFEILTKPENPNHILVKDMRAKWTRLNMYEMGQPNRWHTGYGLRATTS
jgi:hypothetical protein